MDVAHTFAPGKPGPVRRWLRQTLVLAAFAAVTVGAWAQAKDESVIYPRGSNAPEAAAGRAVASGPNDSLVLAVALLAGAGAWWLWLKKRGLTRSAALGGARLSIAETRSLGSRQYLVVADYDGRKFLLGVCPGSIELLTPLDGDQRKD